MEREARRKTTFLLEEQMTLTREDFRYNLSPEKIAQKPLDSRDSSRLLVWNGKSRTITDSIFSKLSQHIEKDSIIVRNNSRVIPSRIFGLTPYGGKVEIMLIAPIEGKLNSSWKVFAKPLKKLKIGLQLSFESITGTVSEIIRTSESPYAIIDFDTPWTSFYDWVENYGNLPLPPYIQRNYDSNEHKEVDKVRYQTVYSQTKGSVAAPTAGLHFTDQLITELQDNSNVSFLDVTLHVGAGTFLPVKSSVISEHTMHEEKYFVAKKTMEDLNRYKKQGRKIYSIGTTTFRCLESFYKLYSKKDNWESLCDQWHPTNLFIYPRVKSDKYQPYFFDGIITNFHQPESTLLMLISSLVGFDNMQKIYSHALNNNYRFLSYGDSSLLEF